ncbi:esterase family protein [Saccharopolyspora indica]|uniref:alpha/beta hydrolase n=1 Tax=Saccharopolyspora indica TaxID=1229659 RepID=UPI0022EAD374|nr:alpha/beta hydrolase family protein [Saccharopolyspora indica]MDA3644266.1 alpha/beta hydrolase family protein [Saccharopolyspora indica]
MKPSTRFRALAFVGALLLIPVAPASATTVADDGARVVSETRVDDRTIDLVIDSPALGTTAPVRLLLPTNYESQPDRLFPQLWLLHGCCSDQDVPPTPDYVAWTEHTDVAAFTADKDVLVVMPSGGQAGFYSAWRSGAPDWERFHTSEVRQIVERNYRANQTRAVAGLSIGGYGAMAYAFRHKGMFRAAASYSGLPNTLAPGVAQWIQAILVREGFGPFDLWGSERWNHDVWSEHNPFDHLDDLRGTALYVSAGNGRPGPLDPSASDDPVEMTAYVSSRTFTDVLWLRGIPVTVNYYGNGTHGWPYWERELHTSWPFLAAALGL